MGCFWSGGGFHHWSGSADADHNIFSSLVVSSSFFADTSKGIHDKLFEGYDGSDEDKEKLYKLILRMGDIDTNNQREKEKLFFFWDNFIPLVSGVARYNSMKARGKKPSRALTAQDEAWALLNWENNFYFWEDEYVGRRNSSNDKYVSQVAPKYTRKEGTRGIQKGWSEEGEKRYDELLGLVIKDRQTEKRIKLEKEYMELSVADDDRKGSSKKSKKKGNTEDCGGVDPRKYTKQLLKAQLENGLDSEDSSDEEGTEKMSVPGHCATADEVVYDVRRRAVEMGSDSSDDGSDNDGATNAAPV